MAPSTSSLGDFLHARRALVRPEEVGLTASPHRRLPGLRREEVAALAGISAAYYLRLERGRDRRPSPEVTDALARVLRLDADARVHLHALARGRPAYPAPYAPETVPEPVRRLVLSRTDTPAFVQGRYHDVLVANPLATALSPSYRTGVNLLRATFLSDRVRVLYDDWDRVSASVVASVRAQAGPAPTDPRFAALIAELRSGSEEFRLLWDRHDVRPRTAGGTRLVHPTLGVLDLSYEKLSLLPDEGQVLVVYHAAPGSREAALLASLDVTATRSDVTSSPSEGPSSPSDATSALPEGPSPPSGATSSLPEASFPPTEGTSS
ncbi:helix-turn-helix domain-containing protein [Streptomyces sp. NPDC059883]|uniref:helix-turn-helix domain-containing protein n=1 Tax=unclassified Streptomyces TaxID=2593676 RepID=UPI0036477345